MSNKFHAQTVDTVYGKFDSKKEYAYFCKMQLLEHAMQRSERVVKIERQVRYDLIVNGINIGFYKLDFRITYFDGTIKHVDVKGYTKGAAYQLFRLKKRIVEAQYSIVIEEA